MKFNKTITLALLTAISLVLFVIETQIPPITPIPGIKLGLANMVTLFILHRRGFTALDAMLVLTVRVLLAGFVTGSLFSLIFSLSGGFAAVFIMLLFRQLFNRKMIPVISVTGAIAHNITQISVAILVYGGMGVLLYLPVLILGGILSGFLTGFAVTIILKRTR